MKAPVRVINALMVVLTMSLAGNVAGGAPAASAATRDHGVVYVDDGGSGHFDLFIVHRDHSLRQVTHLPTGSDAFFPDWAPDGSEIAFVVSTSAGSQIYTVRPD